MENNLSEVQAAQSDVKMLQLTSIIFLYELKRGRLIVLLCFQSSC